jgi:hypothetical protein
MSALEKWTDWADRVYSETDFGRSVATTVAGVVGLTVYLIVKDTTVAVFCSVIAFPMVRLLASFYHKRFTKLMERREKDEAADYTYHRLSSGEKAVVQGFVESGGCVMTWGQFNRSSLPSAGIESLMHRELLSTSVTADGMTETFVLDAAMFDVGVRNRPNDGDEDSKSDRSPLVVLSRP